MQQNFVSSPYVAAEFKARQHREGHDFIAAALSARDAAAIAAAEGDSAGEWDMKFFQAENLMDAGEFDECAAITSALVQGPSAALSSQSLAKGHVLLATARQRAGLLEQAVHSARTAADLTAEEPDIEINVKARHALIAALADCGMLTDAWGECQVLAAIVSDEVDEQLAGKAFWAIGNVAFLCNDVEEGLRYHELAAATFSPARNLDVWAKFNKASAAMRLAADVADADTLRCIERAELATDVIGGSANDHHLLKLNRAHWTFLAGDAPAAIGLLEDLCRLEDGISPQRAGEACLLLGRAYLATGNNPAARDVLLRAAEQFETAGAPQRADQAREYLANEV